MIENLKFPKTGLVAYVEGKISCPDFESGVHFSESTLLWFDKTQKKSSEMFNMFENFKFSKLGQCHSFKVKSVVLRTIPGYFSRLDVKMA